MNYQICEVDEHEKEALAQLRIAAMQESLEAIGRFDPARARGRFTDSFDREATRKVEIDGHLIGFYAIKDKGTIFIWTIYISTPIIRGMV